MGEASSAAPELLGHTCAAGTAFVQVIAELIDVMGRRETVAYLEKLWQADPSSMVDATQNPLSRVHSGSCHLAIRFARLVVDGRVHHIIVSIEKISAPRLVPHTIEVPVLNEETFAKRLAGETGTRPALVIPPAAAAPASGQADEVEAGTAEQPIIVLPTPASAAPAAPLPLIEVVPAMPEMASAAAAPAEHTPLAGVKPLGPLDVTEDSIPSLPALPEPQPEPTMRIATLSMDAGSAELAQLATTITSPETAQAATRAAPEPDPSSIVDPSDARLSEVLKEVMRVEPSRLENFLAEAREKAGQLRAILKLPAREPQAFREKLVLILELIRGIHARAQRLPLRSVCERAERFEEALGMLRDKPVLSGNDFLPIAVKLDDLLSHLAIQGEVVTRLRDWRVQN